MHLILIINEIKKHKADEYHILRIIAEVLLSCNTKYTAMKTLTALFLIIALRMCQEPYLPEVEELYSDAKQATLNNSNQKSMQLISMIDNEDQLSGIVVPKQFYHDEDMFELYFTYPYITAVENEVFNNYIQEHYLNIDVISNQILEDKEIQCNAFEGACGKDKKFLEYKVHALSDEQLSVLMYQENYYSGSAHSSYKFECLNYLLGEQKFIKFDDVFVANAEHAILNTLNEKIEKGIKKGDIYYDCWKLSEVDFLVYKDNFLIDENTITYYFDDCVICPSFTGTYSIDIPVEEIVSLLNVYKDLTI